MPELWSVPLDVQDLDVGLGASLGSEQCIAHRDARGIPHGPFIECKSGVCGAQEQCHPPVLLKKTSVCTFTERSKMSSCSVHDCVLNILNSCC